MREKQLEAKLSKAVKERGGLCEKWTSGTCLLYTSDAADE